MERVIYIVLALVLLSACQAPTAPAGGNMLPVSSPTAVISPTLDRAPSPTPAARISPSASPDLPTVTPEIIPSATPDDPALTHLLFTGVIVPARCVQAALDEIGDPNYPYEEVRQTISSADIAIGTFNAALSDYPPRTGCVRTYVLVGDPDNADALVWAGFDLMAVATNHIKDCGLANCGDRAFIDTLDNLRRVGLPYVGAGMDQAQALQPVVIEANGVRFGFVSLGDSRQGEWTFAGPDTPGIARLTQENMHAAIEAARRVADVVIALPHWGPEEVSVPNGIQRQQAQYIVEAGADLVVGNHTHVVQGIQEIEGVPVFYGLGNFVFDQGLRDLQQGVILIVTFEGTQYTGYTLLPTHVDQDGRVHLAAPEEAAEILQRIQDASMQLR